jgi:hypothetical protein
MHELSRTLATMQEEDMRRARKAKESPMTIQALSKEMRKMAEDGDTVILLPAEALRILDALDKRTKALEGAVWVIEYHGEHNIDCHAHEFNYGEKGECGCGLAARLKDAREALEE